MKRFLCIVIAVLAALPIVAAEHNPVADAKAVVVADNVRFTVLTPQLIRMEWSADGRFEDSATLTFVNRRLPVPEFKVRKSRKSITIKTDYVTLTYNRTGKFSPENLSAVIAMGGKQVVWHYGDVDTQNLMGTTRTLDGADGAKLRESDPMEPGILSRGGWSVVDDSQRHLLVPVKSHWKHWVECRPEGERQDLYLFAYGHEYTKALSDYTKVAGRIPLPPKFSFGYWWSRYWQYSDNELRDLVATMKSLDIPIDVLIVDMDWHETWGLSRKNPKKDEYGQRVGWTGYTWKKQLFPSPKNFMQWCHNEKLKVSLNLHPASGIQPYEEPYERFVKEYGWKEQGKSVPFRIDEQKWADAYFNTVLGPMEKDGVDFWWLDWQQWKESKFTKGLSNTFWLNHTFAHHMGEQGNNRPFIYHRWGGLGSHRYQVGFSGDTRISWESLAFLPWFTATASNVGYGYWGHDIGGHMFRKNEKNPSIDPELYLRWLQYGVFTPIFKTHCTKNHLIERRIWMFPEHMFDMRAAIRLRYTLAPYIYNAARATYDTGVSMCRPMYYTYAERNEAYDFKEQFMFGDDMLVAPVVSPVDKQTGLAERKVWFPEGKWFDMATGRMYEGGTELLHYTLGENPYFVKAGAVIPMNPPTVKSLQEECSTLVLTVIPGGEGDLCHYEDDGESRNYDTQYALTRVTNRTKGKNVCVTIAAREGSYKGAPERRAYELRFPAQMPPKRVQVDGKVLDYSRFGGANTWTYDGYTLSPGVYVAERECGKECVVELIYDAEQVAAQPRLYGKQGVFSRCVALMPELKIVYAKYYDPYPLMPDAFMNVSQAPNFIVEDPMNIIDYIDRYERSLGECVPALEALGVLPKEFIERLRAQLYGK